MPSRGRPPLQSDEVILDAALASFASVGYTATSVRSLNAELGLSHETITQRFGPKPALFRATVRHGLARFVADFDAAVAAARPVDDLARLRAVLGAFMLAASRHPSLGELLHQGGLAERERAELTEVIGLDARIVELSDLLRRLRRAGRIGGVTVRDLWFLAQAGAAPLQFRHISSMFDHIDGPIESDHLDRMVALVIRGLVVERAEYAPGSAPMDHPE